MSDSPPASPPASPRRRPLYERRRASSERAGRPSQEHGQPDPQPPKIRLVPYSPPRISSDGTVSRPTSYVENSTSPAPQPSSPSPTPTPSHGFSSPSDNIEVFARDTPELSLGTQHSPPSTRVSSSVRPSRGNNRGYNFRGRESNFTREGAASRAQSSRALASTSPSPSPGPSGSLSPSLSPSPTSSRAPSPYRRSKRIITINPDNKTFSLVSHDTSATSADDSIISESTRSTQPTLTTPRSSYGRTSSGTSIDYPPTSPLTPVRERSVSLASSVASPSLPHLPPPTETQGTASPANYNIIGGVRKVPQTPNVIQKQPILLPETPEEPRLQVPQTAHCGVSPTPDPDLPPLPALPRSRIPTLTEKPSFTSSESSATDSTLSERTNYKVYGESSPIRPGSAGGERVNFDDLESQPSPTRQSNYQILGDSTPSSNLSYNDQSRPPTGQSDLNYVLHGPATPSVSSQLTTTSPVRPQYSQESLVVAPLRPLRRRSSDHIGPLSFKSRDSLRAASLASLSSVFTQDTARALFMSTSTVHMPPSGPQKHNSWAGPSPTSASFNAPQMISAHPHQWSSQLSTVASESEPESGPPSRSLSAFSIPARRSSGFVSNHSRHVLSISSLPGIEQTVSATSPHSLSGSGSLERPAPVLSQRASRDPSSGNLIQIRDHDEDGDGLADLEDSRIPYFLNRSTSDRNLRSSASSRSNSLSLASIPAWARVYYGSGQRRFVITQPSSESMVSLYNDSRPGSSARIRSPSLERFAGGLFSPRRRPRDPSAAEAADRSLEAGSTSTPEQTAEQANAVKNSKKKRKHRKTGSGLASIIPDPTHGVVRTMKKQTSSIWSPHLRQDRRASGYSIWDPPSAVWSDDAGLTGRRNLQVVLFVCGFIFPFAWMIAAFLPLPPLKQLDMAERLQSTSHLDLQQQNGVDGDRSAATNATRHYSAKWWRNLNRGMAVVGLLVVAAVIALTVVGLRQDW